MSALVVVLGFVPLATLLTALLWPKTESTWGKRLLPAEAAQPYRKLALVRWTKSKEPRIIRVTSALTAFLGGMVFPGGFAGIVGIVAAGAMLVDGDLFGDPVIPLTIGLAASVPTGLVIAIRCFRLFGPMLENRAGVPERMQRLARFSLIHNVAVALVWAVYLGRGGDPTTAIFSLYVLVSLIHVVLLRRAAAVMKLRSEESLACERTLVEAGANVLIEELPEWKSDGPGVAAEPEATRADAPG